MRAGRSATWLAGLMTVAWALPAAAQPGMHMGRGGGFGPGRIEAIAAQLGVTDPVLTKIKDLAFKAEQEAIGIRADMQRAELELKRLLDQDRPDTNAVMRQVDQVGAIETRMRKNRIQLLLSVRELLTPEQRAKLGAMMMEFRGRGMGGPPDGAPGMGPGQGMGPGTGMGPGAGMGPGGGRRGPGPKWR